MYILYNYIKLYYIIQCISYCAYNIIITLIKNTYNEKVPKKKV